MISLDGKLVGVPLFCSAMSSEKLTYSRPTDEAAKIADIESTKRDA